MVRFIRTLILIGLICSATSAFAAGANWYVLKGATGSNNGTSWTNAWNEMGAINFSTVACGDTIWLGGGTYSQGLGISKTCTSSAPLVIQSVLSTDTVPTSAPGYSSAVLNQVILSNSGIDFLAGAYVTVSGRQGNPGVTNFGITTQCTLSSGGCWGSSGAENGAIDHMTLSYVDIYGPACAAASSCTGNADGFNVAPSPAGNTVTYLLIDHDYIHRWSENIRASLWSNCTIQYSWIAGAYTTNAEHADIIYSYPNVNLTMRYNKIWDSTNDGVWMDDGGGVNFAFYGNVVYESGGWLMGFPRCSSACGPVHIYNNTFENDGTFGDYSPGFIGYSATGLTSDSEVANNIFYNISNQFSAWSNHNAYSSNVFSSGETGSFAFTPGSPLTSYAGFVNINSSNPVAADYHLTSAGATTFKGGKTLAAPYNMDMDGNNRGANATWYIGAYTFGSNSAPQPPTGLTITVQ